MRGICAYFDFFECSCGLKNIAVRVRTFTVEVTIIVSPNLRLVTVNATHPTVHVAKPKQNSRNCLVRNNGLFKMSTEYNAIKLFKIVTKNEVT